MKKNRLTISFVGVYEKPMQFIPSFDNKFCRDLFGKPYETTNGLTPEGYAITITGKPSPLVLINPNKIVFKSGDDDTLALYVSKFIDKLPKTNFMAYGINYEYECLELSESSDSWLWKHFFRNGIVTPNDFHICNHLKISLGVNDKETLNVEMEPRAGVEKGLFISCNHHHQEELSELPSKEVLSNIINKSTECINKVLFKNLIEND